MWARDAFEAECRHFHEYGGTEKLDNHLHPASQWVVGGNVRIASTYNKTDHKKTESHEHDEWRRQTGGETIRCLKLHPFLQCRCLQRT